MAYAGKNPSRTSDSALSTLPLLLYLSMAAGLMVLDHRDGYGQVARQQLSLVTAPVWWLASAPMQIYRAARENLSLRSQLQDDNLRKGRELEVATARIHRLNAVAAENVRLRRLLGGTRGYNLNVRLAGIIDIDLDPFRQRLMLDVGSEQGVEVGQALIDSGGVLGQVVEVSRDRSTALLITDPDHAVPVQVARSGLRTVAYGTGSSDRLVLPNIPQSADIRDGDVLITSGIGGRFPAGFPVGVINGLRADNLRLFVIAEATPSAHLERGNEVLLIHNLQGDTDIGPPAPERPALPVDATPTKVTPSSARPSPGPTSSAPVIPSQPVATRPVATRPSPPKPDLPEADPARADSARAILPGLVPRRLLPTQPAPGSTP